MTKFLFLVLLFSCLPDCKTGILTEFEKQYFQPIQDPDPVLNCDLMDGRDAFLTMARERHYEFSSLRRAKFSSMSMLYELHNQGQDKFVYTCNNCKSHVETRYHCTVCDVSARSSTDFPPILVSLSRQNNNNNVFFSFRTLISVLVVKKRTVTLIRWRSLAWIWTMVRHRPTRNKRILR